MYIVRKICFVGKPNLTSEVLEIFVYEILGAVSRTEVCYSHRMIKRRRIKGLFLLGDLSGCSDFSDLSWSLGLNFSKSNLEACSYWSMFLTAHFSRCLLGRIM